MHNINFDPCHSDDHENGRSATSDSCPRLRSSAFTNRGLRSLDEEGHLQCQALQQRVESQGYEGAVSVTATRQFDTRYRQMRDYYKINLSHSNSSCRKTSLFSLMTLKPRAFELAYLYL